MDATFTHIHWPLPRPTTLVYRTIPFLFVYGGFTLFPSPFQNTSTRKTGSKIYNTPHLYNVTIIDSVWALPFSLAATNGISIDFSSLSYSDASLRTVRPPRHKAREYKRETSFGNPEIDGRMHLPQAYRSLPRPSSLSKPSHPPTGVVAPAHFLILYFSSFFFNLISLIN